MKKLGHKKIKDFVTLNFYKARTRILVLLVALCLGASARVNAGIFFHDRFDNAISTNQNGESPDKWIANNSGSSGDTSTAVETGNYLILTAKQSTGTFQPESSLYFQAPDTGFNFWAQKKTVVIRGIKRSGTEVGNGQCFYITIMSKSGRPSSTVAAKFFMRILGTNNDSIFMGWSSSVGGYPAANLISNALAVSSSKNAIKDIILTLGLNEAGNQLEYNVSFLYAGANSKDSNNDGFIDKNDTGMGALAGALSQSDTVLLKNQWLADNGVSISADAKSVLALSSRRTTANTAYTSIIEIGDVQIFEMNENPIADDNDLALDVFKDEFNDGEPIQIDQESPTHWCSAQNYQSWLSETFDKLTLKASNTDSYATAYASLYFRAISPDLNFWERPVGIHVAGVSRDGTVLSLRQNLFVTIMSTAINPFSGSGAGPKIELRITGNDDKAGWKWTGQSGRGLLYTSDNNFLTSDFITVSTVKNTITDIKIILDGTGPSLKHEVRFFDLNNTLLYTISGSLDETETTALKNAWTNYANGAALGLTATRSSIDSYGYAEVKIGSVELFYPGMPESKIMDRDFAGASITQTPYTGLYWLGYINGGDWISPIPRSRGTQYYYYAVDDDSTLNNFIENDICPDIMPWGNVEYVNSFGVTATDPLSGNEHSRVQLNWNPLENVTDIFTAVYVKLEDKFQQNMEWTGTNKWRNMVEIRTYPKNGATNYMRSTFGFETTGANGPYWAGRIEYYNGSSYTFPCQAIKYGSEVPFPVDKWFLMTVLYKHGIGNGIFEVRIRVCKDGGGFEGPWQTMCSFHNKDTQYVDAVSPGIAFVNFMKAYTNLIDTNFTQYGGILQNYYRPRLWVNP